MGQGRRSVPMEVLVRLSAALTRKTEQRERKVIFVGHSLPFLTRVWQPPTGNTRTKQGRCRADAVGFCQAGAVRGGATGAGATLIR